MQFFYVLVNGVSRRTASVLIKNTYQYEKTLNRRFNIWSKDKIFENIKEDASEAWHLPGTLEDLWRFALEMISGREKKISPPEPHELGWLLVRHVFSLLVGEWPANAKPMLIGPLYDPRNAYKALPSPGETPPSLGRLERLFQLIEDPFVGPQDIGPVKTD